MYSPLFMIIAIGGLIVNCTLAIVLGLTNPWTAGTYVALALLVYVRHKKSAKVHAAQVEHNRRVTAWYAAEMKIRDDRKRRAIEYIQRDALDQREI